jgi:4-amino-4-deoxy-L-arabinose transferase-like glycosyltransferase
MPVLIQEGESPLRARLAKRILKAASLASLALLLSVVGTLSANAEAPSGLLVAAAQVLAVLSLGSAALAVASGVVLVYVGRPDLRRPLVFVVILTFAVFAAHLYIINDPPTSVPGTLTGAAGHPQSDSYVTVTSTLNGSTLYLDVRDSGSNAIDYLSVSFAGVPLPASGLTPAPSAVSPIEPASSAFSGLPTDSLGRWSVQGGPSSALTVDYRYMTCYHVPQVGDSRGVLGCVMDETYYVPSALGILGGTQCAPSVPNCNLEHPPLAKALMAAGMAVFGVGTLGWRLPIALMGSLSVPLLFVLVYQLTREKRASYFASLVFAADILFFVHSSAGLIDVPAIFFSLLAFVVYFRKGSLWKVNNYIGAGILLGLAALSKETALFALLGLVSYELIFGEGGRRERFATAMEVVGASVAAFAAGLQLFDSVLASAAFPTFFNQVGYILSYGINLPGHGWCLTGAGSCPNGPYITPVSWLTFYNPVSYLVTVVSVTVSGGASTIRYVGVGYYGLANPVIVWMVYVWLPYAIYQAVKGRHWRTTLTEANRASGFIAIWFLWAYVPYIPLWLYGRVTYPFYLLPAIPALAAGAAYFVTRPWFPRKIAIVYLVGAFAIFFIYFPSKDFLPVWVRALIGR